MSDRHSAIFVNVANEKKYCLVNEFQQGRPHGTNAGCLAYDFNHLLLRYRIAALAILLAVSEARFSTASYLISAMRDARARQLLSVVKDIATEPSRWHTRLCASRLWFTLGGIALK